VSEQVRHDAARLDQPRHVATTHLDLRPRRVLEEREEVEGTQDSGQERVRFVRVGDVARRRIRECSQT
jgi:hypothetical protein